jgi:hypothetical protein
VYQLEGEVCKRIVLEALDMGYRLIDTAQVSEVCELGSPGFELRVKAVVCVVDSDRGTVRRC